MELKMVEQTLTAPAPCPVKFSPESRALKVDMRDPNAAETVRLFTEAAETDKESREPLLSALSALIGEPAAGEILKALEVSDADRRRAENAERAKPLLVKWGSIGATATKYGYDRGLLRALEAASGADKRRVAFVYGVMSALAQ